MNWGLGAGSTDLWEQVSGTDHGHLAGERDGVLTIDPAG
jgi:hypothetical protein